MPASLGLSTYRWNNNIKSMLLLAAFPLLLLALLGGFFYIVGFFQAGPDGLINPRIFQNYGLPLTGAATPYELAREGVLATWPYVAGVAFVWTVVGYLFNDAMIHAAAGAKPVLRTEAPELYNLLENLCIARGVKMPGLYMMNVDEMNAFASGMHEGNYSITVTRGLLEKLDKTELEAVLGHELTHILNRDVRLLVVTVVFTGMISFAAQMLWRSLRFSSYSRRDGKGRGGAFAVMIIALVLLAIGYLVALILRFALSRKREYLADAGSVELTKNPEALIGALEKISSNPHVPHVPAEVRQMFIENPPTMFTLFDTHPPIEDRIKVLRALGGLPPEGKSVIPKVGI